MVAKVEDSMELIINVSSR